MTCTDELCYNFFFIQTQLATLTYLKRNSEIYKNLILSVFKNLKSIP